MGLAGHPRQSGLDVRCAELAAILNNISNLSLIIWKYRHKKPGTGAGFSSSTNNQGRELIFDPEAGFILMTFKIGSGKPGLEWGGIR